jgi:hypothetical protein
MFLDMNYEWLFMHVLQKPNVLVISAVSSIMGQLASFVIKECDIYAHHLSLINSLN